MKSSGESTVVTAYDPVELRRRIAVSFSAPELRRLAEELGVAGQIGWDRGHDESARSLVRQFERYYGLETLVENLRARRPLVEWPEPQPVQTPAAQLSLGATVIAPGSPESPDAGIAPYATTAPTVPGAPALPALAASPGSLGAPPLSASPGSFGAPPLSASPGSIGGKALPRVPVTELDEGPLLPDPMIPMEPAATRGRPLPGWAGMEPASPPARPGRSAQRLLWIGAGAAILALAALLAFAAGRASTKDASTRPTEASATSSPSSPGAAEGAAEEEERKALSARAALAIARALAAVGRVCELPPSTPRDAAMLARALEQCGPAPLPDRPLATPSRPRTPPPHAEQDDAPERPRAPKAPDPGPRVPTSNERPCIRACDAALQTCKGRCGPEPTESRKYEGYQLCQSRCLSTASSCRLACP